MERVEVEKRRMVVFLSLLQHQVKQVMCDPVVDADGVSYEHQATELAVTAGK